MTLFPCYVCSSQWAGTGYFTWSFMVGLRSSNFFQMRLAQNTVACFSIFSEAITRVASFLPRKRVVVVTRRDAPGPQTVKCAWQCSKRATATAKLNCSFCHSSCCVAFATRFQIKQINSILWRLVYFFWLCWRFAHLFKWTSSGQCFLTTYNMQLTNNKKQWAVWRTKTKNAKPTNAL